MILSEKLLGNKWPSMLSNTAWGSNVSNTSTAMSTTNSETTKRKANRCLKSKGRFKCSNPLVVMQPYPIVATSIHTMIGEARL